MDYPIDYELYTTQEIIDIIAFLNAIESYPKQPKEQDTRELKERYQTYRKIINNPATEKTIDKAFYKQTNISIYQIIKTL